MDVLPAPDAGSPKFQTHLVAVLQLNPKPEEVVFVKHKVVLTQPMFAGVVVKFATGGL